MNATLNDSLDDIFPADPVSAPRALPPGNEWDRIRALDGAAPVAKAFVEKCPKCRGSGRFISYSGRALGPCFACKGKGEREFKTAPTVRAAARDRAAAQPLKNWDAFRLSHPAEAEFIDLKINDLRCPEGYREILTSFRGAVGKYGELTGKQLAVVQRGVEREEEFKAKRAVTAQAPKAEFPNLRAAFQVLIDKGVRKAQMTYGDINVSLASLNGKNPGALYVKDGADYAGKIVGTVFSKAYGAKADLVERLLVVEADPKAAVMKHAKDTAERLAAAEARGEKISLPCGCCGIELTNPVSIARGIGPICAGKWGF